MRILKLNNTPVGTNLPNITKTEQPPLKDQDKFQKSSSNNTPDRSVKEWIKENSIQGKPTADTKKNSTLATIGIAGAGVAGVVAGYILGGAAGAGAAGSLVGYALGHAGDSKDNVSEKWNNHDIENPVKLTGCLILLPNTATVKLIIPPIRNQYSIQVTTRTVLPILIILKKRKQMFTIPIIMMVIIIDTVRI